jgi:hypothetical protein
LASLLAACGDDGLDASSMSMNDAMPAAAPAEDASSPPMDASPATTDAATLDAAHSGGAPAPVVNPLPDSVCSLAVGAWCDGKEDCAQGQTCCGRFEPVRFMYTSIGCKASCDGSNDFELCHPGESCTREGTECRSSLIIPHAFIGVCAGPESSLPVVTGASVAGKIACGGATCDVGVEQCCLRSRYDFRTMGVSALEPYCAPPDHRCSCNHEPVDAGSSSDGGEDQDAG